jgi:hypothetical protein
MKITDLKILVIGSNGCWAKGDTLAEALKLSYRPKEYLAYIAHNMTTVDGMGSLNYPRHAAPKEIIRKGLGQKKAVN